MVIDLTFQAGPARTPARRLATRSAAIAGAAQLARMLMVELELGWFTRGRLRRRAELAGMLVAGHQVGGPCRHGRAHRPARGRA